MLNNNTLLLVNNPLNIYNLILSNQISIYTEYKNSIFNSLICIYTLKTLYYFKFGNNALHTNDFLVTSTPDLFTIFFLIYKIITIFIM